MRNSFVLWAYRLRGESARALPLLREAARRLPGEREVVEHLIRALKAAGEAEEARRVRERFLERAPSPPAAAPRPEQPPS